jgi:hypothetical protein
MAGGCPSHVDPGGAKATLGADGKERWVVTFEGEAPDPAEYRTLAKDNPKAADAYAAQMRDAVMKGRTEIESFLTSVDGRVVERWWMSNAITVELPAGAVESLRKQTGVKSVAPDQTLE